MDPERVRRVGVVGCGIMGSGIVEVVARSGAEVVYREVDEEAVHRGRQRVEASTAKAVAKDKLSDGERRGLLDRVSGTTDLEDLADADVVIEAATEDIETKLGVFRRLDEIVRPDVVLCSNTSSIPIVAMATVTKRPDRVIGTHFFNPPPIMKLLEIIPAITTSEETVAFADAFGGRLGKRTVRSRDRAGFIVNFLLMPYLNSAARMFDEGFATKEDIDAAVTLGLGHPMGPLTLLDFIGLDTALHVSNVLFDEFKDPLYAAPTILQRMVQAGWLGRKAGKGFYDYEP